MRQAIQPISFKRPRLPPETIRLAVWLYFRLTMSLRDVEEMLAERRISNVPITGDAENAM